MNSRFKTHLSICFIFLTISAFAQSDKQEKIKIAAKQIIEQSRYCALITVDELGQPAARMMDPFLPDDDFVVWLATNPKSKKVKHMINNPKVTLYYTEPSIPGYVSIYATAELINDAQEKEMRWKEGWEAFYPDREKSYLLIKVTPHRMEVVNYQHQILGDTITWLAPTIRFK